MNSFGRTIAAVAVAAGLFGYIYFVESKKELKADESALGSVKREKVFTGLDKLKVKSITLKKRGGDIVQVEKNAEAWSLVAPQAVPADSGEIGTLLDGLERLESEEVVIENATDLAPFGLLEPKVSVSLVVEGAQKPLELDLGDGVPAGSSLFARVPGKPALFTVTTTIENTLSKTAFDLRDRGVIKVKKDAIRSFEAVEKGQRTFRLVRGEAGEDDWKVESPVQTRAGRWSADSFLGLIENLRMESIASEDAKAADLAKYGLGNAARRVILGLDESKSLTLEIGKKTADSKYYARDAASKLVGVIPTAVVDDLDKGLQNLRATRLLDVATYEVTRVDATAAGTARTFTKTTTKGKDGIETIDWKSVAPFKDVPGEAATSAMIAIGGVEVSEFIDAPKALSNYGLDSPSVRVSLHFEGGKKEDWFEVSVRGEAGFARRKNDASVLKIDKTKAENLIKAFTSLGS